VTAPAIPRAATATTAAPETFDWCVGCDERPALDGGVVCEPCYFSEPADFTVVVVYGTTYLLQHRRLS
jgi:hypothetical protein